MRNKVLIVGGDSVIGSSLAQRLRESNMTVVTTTRRDVLETEHCLRLDLSAPVDNWQVSKSFGHVIFCAAVGSTDTCRKQPKATRAINVDHTIVLARRFACDGSFVLLLSTNMVHNGARQLVPAGDDVSPCLEYGRQKADAERTFLSLGDQGAVVRLTKVFQPGIPLLERWIRMLANGGSIEAFNDYFCSPVALWSVVEGIKRIIDRREDAGGIWQFSPPDQISYAEIACEIASGLRVPLERVKKVTAFGKLEHIPRFTSLDASRAIKELQISFDMSASVIQKICFP